jgi:CRP-like cAMP-binding protein
MAKRFGEKQKNGHILIDLPLRQQDTASSINASRETAGRELSRLEQKGLIKTTHSRITLIDIDKLWTYFK